MNRICLQKKILLEKMWQKKQAYRCLLFQEYLITVDMSTKKKKKKIIKIAEQLGYIPNPIAMALQTRRTYQIIFFCNDLTGAYYNQMYHGMAKTAKERGYHLLLQKDYDFESVKKSWQMELYFRQKM